jgi:glycosyltransferase involved in cell wall biosynthesis
VVRPGVGPLVSITIPAYQNAAYIERTVVSALRQDYPSLEVCIADHTSTDGTWERLRQYEDDPRVRLVRTRPGGGAQRNWNAVTQMSTGELVKLLPGDDVLYPDCVSTQVEALLAHPSAVLASSRRDLIDVNDATLLRARGQGRLRGLVPGHAAIRSLVRSGTNLLGEPGCVLVDRAALMEAGGWSADYPYLIDQFTYMRVLEYGDLVAVDATLGAFRVSDTQWSMRLASQQAAQARGVHRHFGVALPGVVSARDVRLGDARAFGMAATRRLAYFAWRARTKGPATT